MEDIYCPLCKEKNNKFAFEVQGHQLRMCSVCDLNFIYPYVQKAEERNPLPLEKQLKGEQQSVSSYFKYISTYYKGISSYLDIGCGCGELLHKAKEYFIPLRHGVEEDKQRARFAAKYADCEIFGSDFFSLNKNEAYELISLINVFSHLPDLNYFFKNLHQILSNRGRIIIKTGLFRRGFIKENLFDWQIPEHLHFIGDKTIDYISSKYQFTCIEVINVPLAEELISREFLLSPGLSSYRNWLKKIIYYTPSARFLLKKIYTWYTRGKLYSSIVVLEKK